MWQKVHSFCKKSWKNPVKKVLTGIATAAIIVA
jgi:hypothetical protein